jgi:hypothetical protein
LIPRAIDFFGVHLALLDQPPNANKSCHSCIGNELRH